MLNVGYRSSPTLREVAGAMSTPLLLYTSRGHIQHRMHAYYHYSLQKRIATEGKRVLSIVPLLLGLGPDCPGYIATISVQVEEKEDCE